MKAGTSRSSPQWPVPFQRSEDTETLLASCGGHGAPCGIAGRSMVPSLAKDATGWSSTARAATRQPNSFSRAAVEMASMAGFFRRRSTVIA